MGNSKSIPIAMLGLDCAGKTTILYRMKLGEYSNTVPTVGFNCEKVKGTLGISNGVAFCCWDVGGQDQLRPLWRQYTRASEGIIFVIDSQDMEKIEEARLELQRTARMQESHGMPILVFANKQDLPGALNAFELEKMLRLSDLSPQHKWVVQLTCAVTGEGVMEGLLKLYEMILLVRKGRRKSTSAKRLL